jgi:hypothetical protein
MSYVSPIIVDNFANRPAAGAFVGQRFVSKTGGFEQVWSGTAWQTLVNGILCTEPPSAATFGTQVNYSTTTLTKSNGSLRINAPTAGATQLRCALMTIPTPSACEIQTLPILLNSQVSTGGTGVPCVGVCMRESSTGKIASIKYGFNTPFGSMASILSLGTWSAATTRTSNTDYENGVTPFFVRMRIAGGTLFREISQDLNTWDTVSSNTVTTFFTTAPDQYGICVQVENSMIAYLPHYFTV